MSTNILKKVELSSLDNTETIEGNLLNSNVELIKDVEVNIEVKIGTAKISVGELFALRQGAILELDKLIDEPVDILLKGKLIGAGSLVCVNERFGIEVVEIA